MLIPGSLGPQSQLDALDYITEAHVLCRPKMALLIDFQRIYCPQE